MLFDYNTTVDKKLSQLLRLHPTSILTTIEGYKYVRSDSVRESRQFHFESMDNLRIKRRGLRQLTEVPKYIPAGALVAGELEETYQQCQMRDE